MNIGVLGGSRFIGHHLTEALVAGGHRVTLFNRGRTVPPRPLPRDLRRVRGDRNAPGDLEAFLDHSYDAVFDLSGYTPAHVEPLTNARGRDRIGHYIFCSTSSVYRIPPPCPCPESAPRVDAASQYGGDKRRVEDLLLLAFRESGWPVTIVRPSGVYGPFDPAQTGHVFARLSQSRPIVIGPTGGHRLSLLFVGDLVAVCLRLLGNHAAHGRVYNVAGDTATTAEKLAALCATTVGIEARVRVVHRWPYKHLQVGFQWPDYDLVLANSRVRHDLGVQFTPLAEGLTSTWQWLSSAAGRLQPELSRGERFVDEEGTIPFWARAMLWMDDLTFTSPIRRRLGPIVRKARGA
jgi:nucleoside-diphosphate-sugar epimerase